MEELSGFEVVVESSHIARPPEKGANRFLSGWVPWVHEGSVALGMKAEGGRLQFAHLAPRARTLVLDLVEVTAAGGRVRVTAAGERLGSFPLADPLELPLPDNLLQGRVIVEVVRSGGGTPPIDVVAAGVRPALPAGTVEQDGEDLTQSGYSWAELVREVDGGSQLAGEFVPPTFPEPDQRYRLTLEREGEVLSTFEWAPGWRDRFQGPRRFQLPVGDEPGIVKISLRALGTGPPARWRRLHWLSPEPEPDSGPTPARPAPRGPQVVIVYVMDALRADHVGHLGGPEGISPTWDRLAREGFTFLRHRSLAPSTLPSSRMLFTGRPLRFPAEWDLASEAPLLSEHFQRAGYRTGLFSGNAYVSAAFGLHRGFDHVAEDVLYGADSPGERGGVNVNAARVQESALVWLDSLAPDERAFLYLHTIHPHNPYAPPSDLAARFAGSVDSDIDGSTATLIAIQDRNRDVSEKDKERLRGLYSGAFAYNDRELGKLVVELERRFQKGEVLLILTSDHGEELFDHKGVLHGFTLYEEMLRIPLTLWWPGEIPPGKFDQPSNTLDLHASLLDLAKGSSALGEDRSEGRSLWSVILGTKKSLPKQLQFAAAPGLRGGIFSVLGSRADGSETKLVFAASGQTGWGMGEGRGRTWDPAYYFHLSTDPGEYVNQIGSLGLEEQWLKSQLQAWIQSGEELRARPGSRGGSEPDPETLERLRSLGYLQ